ncbi:MAG TPA: copper amine oxidase N-terminal domain-containing protein [Syntrophomonadaceae bacterium]|nr:copper amine oxidase N-terminal domain-containing protein [Syntrophomonadaceae bacterium]
MKSKFLVIICIIPLLAGAFFCPSAYAAGSPSTFRIGNTTAIINGDPIVMDIAPYIKDGRTFMPIAYVAQALGISNNHIHWDEASQTINMMDDSNVVQVQVGSTTIMVGGGQSSMDVAPEICNGRSCLPTALIVRAFGGTAVWDEDTQTITISARSAGQENNSLFP